MDWIAGTIDEEYTCYVTIGAVRPKASGACGNRAPERASQYAVHYYDGTRSTQGYAKKTVEGLGPFPTLYLAARAALRFAEEQKWHLSPYVRACLRRGPQRDGSVASKKQAERTAASQNLCSLKAEAYDEAAALLIKSSPPLPGKPFIERHCALLRAQAEMLRREARKSSKAATAQESAAHAPREERIPCIEITRLDRFRDAQRAAKLLGVENRRLWVVTSEVLEKGKPHLPPRYRILPDVGTFKTAQKAREAAWQYAVSQGYDVFC